MKLKERIRHSGISSRIYNIARNHMCLHEPTGRSIACFQRGYRRSPSLRANGLNACLFEDIIQHHNLSSLMYNHRSSFDSGNESRSSSGSGSSFNHIKHIHVKGKCKIDPHVYNEIIPVRIEPKSSHKYKPMINVPKYETVYTEERVELSDVDMESEVDAREYPELDVSVSSDASSSCGSLCSLCESDGYESSEDNNVPHFDDTPENASENRYEASVDNITTYDDVPKNVSERSIVCDNVESETSNDRKHKLVNTPSVKGRRELRLEALGVVDIRLRGDRISKVTHVDDNPSEEFVKHDSMKKSDTKISSGVTLDREDSYEIYLNKLDEIASNQKVRNYTNTRNKKSSKQRAGSFGCDENSSSDDNNSSFKWRGKRDFNFQVAGGRPMNMSRGTFSRLSYSRKLSKNLASLALLTTTPHVNDRYDSNATLDNINFMYDEDDLGINCVGSNVFCGEDEVNRNLNEDCIAPRFTRIFERSYASSNESERVCNGSDESDRASIFSASDCSEENNLIDEWEITEETREMFHRDSDDHCSDEYEGEIHIAPEAAFVNSNGSHIGSEMCCRNCRLPVSIATSVSVTDVPLCGVVCACVGSRGRTAGIAAGQKVTSINKNNNMSSVKALSSIPVFQTGKPSNNEDFKRNIDKTKPATTPRTASTKLDRNRPGSIKFHSKMPNKKQVLENKTVERAEGKQSKINNKNTYLSKNLPSNDTLTNNISKRATGNVKTENSTGTLKSIHNREQNNAINSENNSYSSEQNLSSSNHENSKENSEIIRKSQSSPKLNKSSSKNIKERVIAKRTVSSSSFNSLGNTKRIYPSKSSDSLETSSLRSSKSVNKITKKEKQTETKESNSIESINSTSTPTPKIIGRNIPRGPIVNRVMAGGRSTLYKGNSAAGKSISPSSRQQFYQNKSKSHRSNVCEKRSILEDTLENGLNKQDSSDDKNEKELIKCADAKSSKLSSITKTNDLLKKIAIDKVSTRSSYKPAIISDITSENKSNCNENKSVKSLNNRKVVNGNTVDKTKNVRCDALISKVRESKLKKLPVTAKLSSNSIINEETNDTQQPKAIINNKPVVKNTRQSGIPSKLPNNSEQKHDKVLNKDANKIEFTRVANSKRIIRSNVNKDEVPNSIGHLTTRDNAVSSKSSDIVQVSSLVKPSKSSDIVQVASSVKPSKSSDIVQVASLVKPSKSSDNVQVSSLVKPSKSSDIIAQDASDSLVKPSTVRKLQQKLEIEKGASSNHANNKAPKHIITKREKVTETRGSASVVETSIKPAKSELTRNNSTRRSVKRNNDAKRSYIKCIDEIEISSSQKENINVANIKNEEMTPRNVIKNPILKTTIIYGPNCVSYSDNEEGKSETECAGATASEPVSAVCKEMVEMPRAVVDSEHRTAKLDISTVELDKSTAKLDKSTVKLDKSTVKLDESPVQSYGSDVNAISIKGLDGDKQTVTTVDKDVQSLTSASTDNVQHNTIVYKGNVTNICDTNTVNLISEIITNKTPVPVSSENKVRRNTIVHLTHDDGKIIENGKVILRINSEPCGLKINNSVVPSPEVISNFELFPKKGKDNIVPTGHFESIICSLQETARNIEINQSESRIVNDCGSKCFNILKTKKETINEFEKPCNRKSIENHASRSKELLNQLELERRHLRGEVQILTSPITMSYENNLDHFLEAMGQEEEEGDDKDPNRRHLDVWPDSAVTNYRSPKTVCGNSLTTQCKHRTKQTQDSRHMFAFLQKKSRNLNVNNSSTRSNWNNYMKGRKKMVLRSLSPDCYGVGSNKADDFESHHQRSLSLPKSFLANKYGRPGLRSAIPRSVRD